MKKIFFIAATLLLQTQAQAKYYINGEIAFLIECDLQVVGGEIGYVGTYETGSGVWTVWFGDEYCEL